MTTTTAILELPERLIFSERLAISEAAQVPMDAECCRVIQATLDYMRSRYALATLQAQPAEVSDAEIDALCLSLTGFMTRKERDRAVARAILALRPQAVPMTDEQAAKIMFDLNNSRTTGTRCWGWIDVIRAVEAHFGITAPAGGEG